MKKAQIEVSYNWIFVLVAGAVLFGFFISIVVQEQETTQDRIDERFADNLQNLIRLQLQQAPGLTETHNRQRTTFQFLCDDTGHSFRVGEFGNLRYMETEPVFSRNNLGESTLVTQNLELKMPFHTSPLILLSDSNTRFSFDPDSPTALDLYALMGSEFNAQTSLEDIGMLPNEIIITGEASYTNPAASAIFVVKELNTQSRNLKTYSVESDGKTRYVLNQELLLAAVVTGDLDLFDCSVKKVEEKTQLTLQLEINRAKAIRDTLQITDTCYPIIDRLYQDELQTLKDEAVPLQKNEESGIENLLDAAWQVERINRELTSASCPTVY